MCVCVCVWMYKETFSEYDGMLVQCKRHSIIEYRVEQESKQFMYQGLMNIHPSIHPHTHSHLHTRT